MGRHAKTRAVAAGIAASLVMMVGAATGLGVTAVSAGAAPGGSAGDKCDISAGPVTNDVVDSTCDALKSLLPLVGKALGLPTLSLDDQVKVQFVDTPGSSPSTTMETTFFGNPASPEPCSITIYPKGWQATTGPTASDLFRVGLAHEIVHCYQYAVIGYDKVYQGEDVPAVPGWISDGTATYVATRLLNVGEQGTHSFWTGWIGDPATELDGRGYDAVGWYWLIAHVQNTDLYSRMVPAWKAWAAEGTTAAFVKVMGGDDPDVMKAWGPSILNQPPWGDDWTSFGLGVPLAASPAESHDTIKDENVPFQLKAAPLAALVDEESIANVEHIDDEGFVEISTDAGFVSVHDPVGHSYLAFSDEVFCLKDACDSTAVTCPGSPKPIKLLPLVTPFTVVVAGSAKPMTVTMENLPKPKTASTKYQPPASAGPCKPTALLTAPKPAYSEGDPHLLGLNGTSFDFQGVGEYQLVRSTNGEVAIEARSQPAAGSDSVSWNTAVAMRVDSDTVEVDAGSPVVVLVDGKKATLPKVGPLKLKGGGTVALAPDGDFSDVTVTWVDGSRNDVFADARGENSTFTPPVAGVDRFAGLLAATNSTPLPKGASATSERLVGGDGKNYVVDPNTKAGFAALYGPFAASWKVTKSDTLFTYPKGKGVGAFDVKGFPKQSLSVNDLTPAAKAAAAVRCKAQGITDPKLLAGCELDVTETGVTDLAGAAARVQQLINGIAPPTVTATSHPLSYYFSKPCDVVSAAEITAALGVTLPVNLGAAGTCVIGASPIDSIAFSHESATFFAVLAATAKSSTAVPSLGHDAKCITGPIVFPTQSYVVLNFGAQGSLEVLAGSCAQASVLTKDALSHISAI